MWIKLHTLAGASLSQWEISGGVVAQHSSARAAELANATRSRKVFEALRRTHKSRFNFFFPFDVFKRKNCKFLLKCDDESFREISKTMEILMNGTFDDCWGRFDGKLSKIKEINGNLKLNPQIAKVSKDFLPEISVSKDFLLEISVSKESWSKIGFYKVK